MMGAVTQLDELHARQEALEIANTSLHETFGKVDGDAHHALELARQNVKLMSAIRATQLEHGAAIGGLVEESVRLRMRFDDMRSDIAGLKAHMNDRFSMVTSDIDMLKGDVGELKGDVGELKGDVATLKSDVGELKVGLAEVLRRLPA